MHPRLGRGIGLVFLALAFGSGAAGAADPSCQLRQVATLPIQWNGDAMLVPVTLNGSVLPLMLDTGSAITSLLYPSAVAALDLHSREANRHFVMANGHEIDRYVVLDSVDLGPIHTTARQFLVFPSQRPNAAAAGLLGPDIVRHFDMEIDPVHSKINLFLPDHCPGQVVYWTKDYTDAAIRVVQSGHIFMPMVLDGKPLEALLDTGSTQTILSLTTAHRLFDLDTDSPGMTRVDGPNDASTMKRYRHAFGNLTLAGVGIRNPQIMIIQDKMQKVPDKAEIGQPQLAPDEAVKLADLILGMNVIRKLRLYIAFEEGHIYATAANAT